MTHKDEPTLKQYAAACLVGCLFFVAFWAIAFIFDGGYYAG